MSIVIHNESSQLNLLFFVFGVPAHGTVECVAVVESFKWLKTALMIHVRAIQQVDFALPVQSVRVITHRTFFFPTRSEFVIDRFPEFVETVFIFFLLVSLLHSFLSFLIPDASHVRDKRFQELFCVLDWLVHFGDGAEEFFSLLGHHCQILFANSRKFIPDKPFPHIRILRLIPLVLHPLIEVIPR